jgi:anti-sigma factor RsiW
VKHSEVSPRLSRYLEHDLASEERAQIAAHLEGCAECSRELRELRATVALLRRLPEPALPPNLADSLLARVARGDGRESRVISLLRRTAEPSIGAPLAAGIAGLFLFFAADDPAVAPGRTASPTAAASAGAAIAPPRTELLARAATPGTGSAAAGPLVVGAGVVSGATPAEAEAAYQRRVEAVAFASPPDPQADAPVRGETVCTLQHRAAQRARLAEIARLLRGAGHPHSTSLAAHIERRPAVALVDWQPR